MCGYYIEGNYVQLIRSTSGPCFRWRQRSPAWKCIYPKN